MEELKAEKVVLEKNKKKMKQVLLRILKSNHCKPYLHLNVLVQVPEVVVPVHEPPGLKLNSSQKFCLDRSFSCINGSASDESTAIGRSVDCLRVDKNSNKKLRIRSLSVTRRELPESEEILGHMQEVSSTSSTVSMKESVQSKPGWPLLGINTSAVGELSMVNPLDFLIPSSPESQINLNSEEAEDSSEDETSDSEENPEATCLRESIKQAKKMELSLILNSSGRKQFSYKELNKATRGFSSENLIGEGGCSNVYKGLLSGGKLIAVKVLKQYKEALKDFSLEVEIMSLLKHKHITHLIGACIEDHYLILVYDFLPRGSLEEILQGNRYRSLLPWKVRYNVALAIAEALNYLQSRCSPPVIHRDVKSANILLSHDFQPLLSDFGLATWGPEDSTYTTQDDVVGTFGYLAPEYLMHGRVSDKIDVYAFGVLLLELLTGKKSINPQGLKGQQSLVKWATPLLEKGNLKALLDPKLDKDFNIVQAHKMVLAATLCTRQSARLRPKMSQVLKLLGGNRDGEGWIVSYFNDLKQSTKEMADNFSPEFARKPSLNVVSLDLDDDAGILCRVQTSSVHSLASQNRLKLKDYLLEPQD
ncbi:hypothetical protein K2173_027798 [Erythroxylum novogranatense]|uniref:Protein kinase domain-containing protein n=1 Tax=Erythroxylum novogranatense TaxID=1862640 RepID=A0AAV8U1D6_9ROSI|nr:hypothetical protein K2173_027798 [Erythroxylum novogranatense]